MGFFRVTNVEIMLDLFVFDENFPINSGVKIFDPEFLEDRNMWNCFGCEIIEIVGEW
jgi:hypothetical protein